MLCGRKRGREEKRRGEEEDKNAWKALPAPSPPPSPPSAVDTRLAECTVRVTCIGTAEKGTSRSCSGQEELRCVWRLFLSLEGKVFTKDTPRTSETHVGIKAVKTLAMNLVTSIDPS
ncbi:hypothetical protein E2C01_091122 [Portunus trituberculatus]|uniref:Uncharacterized protein n=1 Tax=Portunus trituberculatus TaxID=210409 RepID=A0A5B7JN74_PORTR|nr:hypothetical protein [Portunus trituberculatus]